jgi:hypothetical protein
MNLCLWMNETKPHWKWLVWGQFEYQEKTEKILVEKFVLLVASYCYLACTTVVLSGSSFTGFFAMLLILNSWSPARF